jgi:hypothetical protein
VDQTPGAVPEWQADRVEALWRAGRCAEAATESERLWEWASRGRQPMGMAFAARSRLLVTGDRDLDRWWTTGREAFQALRRPFEQARLALVMGSGSGAPAGLPRPASTCGRRWPGSSGWAPPRGRAGPRPSSGPRAAARPPTARTAPATTAPPSLTS